MNDLDSNPDPDSDSLSDSRSDPSSDPSSDPDPITPAGFDSLPTRRTRKPPRTVTSIILLILGLGLAISSFTVQIVFLGGFDTLETEARQAKTMDESMGAGFAGIAVVVILLFAAIVNLPALIFFLIGSLRRNAFLIVNRVLLVLVIVLQLILILLLGGSD